MAISKLFPKMNVNISEMKECNDSSINMSVTD